MSSQHPIKPINPPDCPQCEGTGYKIIVQGGVERAARCECRTGAYRIERLIRQARIPELYQSATFESFDTRSSNSLSKAKITAQGFVNNYPSEKAGLIFAGSLGLGKTHLAVSALRELLKKGVPGLFYSYADLLTEIKSTYKDGGERRYWRDVDGNEWETESQIINHVTNVEILLLDEIGKVKATEWVLDKIREIIGARYNKRLTTLFTSNYLLEKHQADKSLDPLLEEKIGADTVSRIFEMCKVVRLIGDDFRKAEKRVHRRHAAQQ